MYHRGADEIHALEDVTLRIPRGRFVALMGPSGSGKTTLLNLIAGIDRPSRGSVVVAGQQLNDLTEDELARWRARHVGFIFQFFNLIPVLTARENVELPLLLTHLGKAERRARAETALRIVGLADRADHYPRSSPAASSSASRIARAIVTDPDLIVADEPTGDLDAQERRARSSRCCASSSSDFGKTVVMVTHDPRAALRRRGLHLDKGVLEGETRARRARRGAGGGAADEVPAAHLANLGATSCAAR